MSGAAPIDGESVADRDVREARETIAAELPLLPPDDEVALNFARFCRALHDVQALAWAIEFVDEDGDSEHRAKLATWIDDITSAAVAVAANYISPDRWPQTVRDLVFALVDREGAGVVHSYHLARMWAALEAEEGAA